MRELEQGPTEAKKLREAKEKIFDKVGYKKGEKFKHRPADRLVVKDKKPGWGYRWIEKEKGSIERRESEGFALVNKMTGIPGDIDPESDGMKGAIEHRELVLAALPEELKKARDESIQEQTDRQTASLKENLDQNLGKIPGQGGKAH